MKTLNFAGFAVTMILTAVAPNLALASQSSTETSTSRTSVEFTDAQRLSDLGMRINPQVGVSNLDHSKNNSGSSRTKFSGGATVEFGGPARKLETGLLVLNATDSQFLTIPMMAKLRVLNTRAQSWYGKLGFMPAFEISSTRDAATNNLDVLSSVGFGGRLFFNKKTDLIIEATYNRGLLDSLKSAGSSYNQGFVVLTGMSFSI